MGGIAAAYLASLGVIGFKWAKAGQFPPPIALGGATLIFTGCGILAGIQGGEKFAATVAWAFVAGAIFSPSFGGTVSPVIFGNIAPNDPNAAQQPGHLAPSTTSTPTFNQGQQTKNERN